MLTRGTCVRGRFILVAMFWEDWTISWRPQNSTYSFFPSYFTFFPYRHTRELSIGYKFDFAFNILFFTPSIRVDMCSEIANCNLWLLAACCVLQAESEAAAKIFLPEAMPQWLTERYHSPEVRVSLRIWVDWMARRSDAMLTHYCRTINPLC